MGFRGSETCGEPNLNPSFTDEQCPAGVGTDSLGLLSGSLGKGRQPCPHAPVPATAQHLLGAPVLLLKRKTEDRGAEFMLVAGGSQEDI